VCCLLNVLVVPPIYVTGARRLEIVQDVVGPAVKIACMSAKRVIGLVVAIVSIIFSAGADTVKKLIARIVSMIKTSMFHSAQAVGHAFALIVCQLHASKIGKQLALAAQKGLHNE